MRPRFPVRTVPSLTVAGKRSVTWGADRDHYSVRGVADQSGAVTATTALLHRIRTEGLPSPPSMSRTSRTSLTTTADAARLDCAYARGGPEQCTVRQSPSPYGLMQSRAQRLDLPGWRRAYAGGGTLALTTDRPRPHGVRRGRSRWSYLDSATSGTPRLRPEILHAGPCVGGSPVWASDP